MAHFAKLDENNIVAKVVVIGNDVPTSNGPLGENDMHIDGETYCNRLFGGNWKQTSYNAKFRKKYAGIGNVYDEELDIFRGQQPYSSWTLDSTGEWQAPIAFPSIILEDTGDENYPKHIYQISWNESNQRWESTNYAGNSVIWDPSSSSWS
jgi:hypothetical protein